VDLQSFKQESVHNYDKGRTFYRKSRYKKMFVLKSRLFAMIEY